MKQPRHIPEGEFVTLDKDPLEYKKVPDITFFEEGDGIMYYYDKPLMFVAWIGEQKVIVTLMDEGCNYPDIPRRGWYQHIAIAVTDKLLYDIYNSKAPLRDLWDQKADNWFIQDDWECFDKEPNNVRCCTSKFKVYKNVELRDRWKPEKLVTLGGGNEASKVDEK